MSVLKEVLDANDRYAADFGAKSELALHRPEALQFLPAWMPALTQQSMPA